MIAQTELAVPAEPRSEREEQVQTISVSERRTDELVIALVGAIGSGVTTTAKTLMDILEREYLYNCHYIKVSSIIEEVADKLGKTVPSADRSPDTRTSTLQEIGNVLRGKYSNRYLAEKCIERIAVDRVEPPSGIDKGYKEVAQDGGGASLLPVNRRRVHIIDSIKHTAELDALREVYGDTFWLLGVFAPETLREDRLKNIGHNSSRIKKIFEDDEEDGLINGQKVRDTVHQADFFIRNDGISDVKLRTAISRYLKIIFNVGVNTPTLDEVAMYSAASQASTSACLSRQVGAAIYSEAGELIGVGANDVPKFRGGLYCSEDGDNDYRCFKLTGGICHNDDRKDKLYKSIVRELRLDSVLVENADLDIITKALKRTDIKNLIEYSRSVHAEMEAIISVARGNKPGIVGSTLYCTTFPCHSCARHIVASGVKRVLYIEPYVKSLAVSLHGDAVSMTESAGNNQVAFLQYEGTAPKNMIRLFKHGIARKHQGKMINVDPRTAIPIFPSPLDGFTVREQLIVDNLLKTEQKQTAIQKTEGETPDAKPAKEAKPTQLSLVDPEPQTEKK